MNLDAAVIVAAGSNLAGDYPSCEALLEAAVAYMGEAGLRIVRRSAWWRSAAWPAVNMAPEYRNGVLLVEPTLDAHATLSKLLEIERRFGRRRGEANAARTLDLDLIAFGREVIDVPGLQLPHPRAHERLFVMGPLAQIAPGWRHPVSGAMAATLAHLASVGRDAAPA
ncbi:2-amino-4-hydroxy-6-hydroxymethyldihydropteridine diphosphokinase [Phenylobacterium sp.]|uniref:2-amino-4-hydroxy-6- hydroxymethyldihydropteridine diphosphokinase n=1 Tax=Phenylobacterium sp. TaxID=1871053 RepID=UPI002735D472|nr:2-amino-4-hydroxy-6-hydroxymethyldihydropteridine diphosphokinase [Phenylobacterium sp.]MDP3661044.1 2-amino-4-hydroxy-6-hydroxymethyldihydropteridine diphosphokinase [Phenylobacterium sp.]